MQRVVQNLRDRLGVRTADERRSRSSDAWNARRELVYQRRNRLPLVDRGQRTHGGFADARIDIRSGRARERRHSSCVFQTSESSDRTEPHVEAAICLEQSNQSREVPAVTEAVTFLKRLARPLPGFT